MLFPCHPTSERAPRVVVTGAGIVTALGLGWRANAEGFRTGRQAFRPVTLFDVTRQRTRIAAEVDLPEAFPGTCVGKKELGRLDRSTKMLLLAADEAWAQARWARGGMLPLFLGTTSGGMELGEVYLRQAIREPFSRKRQASRLVHYQMQRQALELGRAFKFSGPIIIISNACASGTNAIGHAWESLRTGAASRALVGGHEGLCQLTFAGFDSLQALAPGPCRPFASDRDGLSLGEGAAVLALETLDFASARGAEILGEIIGYAATTDTYHLTQPHPEGNAAWASMTGACRVAGISPDEVDYVNANGTATLQNDHTEARAINRWAGARAATLPVSSTKASTGHLLGAAGVVEAVVCLMTLREQWLPPETGIGAPDPDCQFPVVHEPTNARVAVALSNSFGFGGANASLLLRRWS